MFSCTFWIIVPAALQATAAFELLYFTESSSSTPLVALPAETYYIVTLSKLKNVLLLTLQAVIFSAAVVTTKVVNYYIISQLRTYFVHVR